MAAGDVLVLGPFRADDTAEIDAGITGQGVVVADDITAHVINGNVVYTIIKAA